MTANQCQILKFVESWTTAWQSEWHTQIWLAKPRMSSLFDFIHESWFYLFDPTYTVSPISPRIKMRKPETHFLALLSFNNVIKAYEGRIPGQMFTLIVNPGSITVFDFWKKFKSFKKLCIFCQSQNSQNKHYFLKLLTFFQKSKHSFWPRIWNQRKNLHQNAFFIRFYSVVVARKCQKMGFG